jgi:hypothetical protein
MKQDKIENIFSEMENFSSMPPPELWNGIEEKLEQPKKKNKGLLWWSVAANILFIASIPLVWYFLLNRKDDKVNVNSGSKNEIVYGKNKLNSNTTNLSVVVSDSNFNKKGNKVILAVKKDSIGTVSKNNIGQNNQDSFRKGKEASVKSENAIVNASNRQDSNSNEVISNNSDSFRKGKVASVKSENAIVNASNREDSNSNEVISNNSDSFRKGKVASVKPENAITNTSKLEDSNSNEVISNNSDSFRKGKVASGKPVDFLASKNKKEEILGENSILKQDNEINIKKQDSLLSKKNQDNNATIASTTQKEARQFTVDSLSKIDSEKQKIALGLLKLESINKKKGIKKKLSQPIDKWSIDVFAGVAATQNTPNSSLGSDTKNIQSNSYGVKTNVALNNRWSVSSGFKLNELGQSTDGVAYFENNPNATSSLVAGYYDPKGIWKTPVTNGTVALDVPIGGGQPNDDLTVVALSDNSNVSFVTENSAKQTQNSTSLKKGEVSQITKYIEMPLEVSYAIISKKKVVLKMNTGGFLGKLISNKTYLNGDYLGKNTTVNDFIYGSKLSGTLQYEFYKKTHLFVEPGINYYMNTIKNDTFKPIQLLVNFGVNVSF